MGFNSGFKGLIQPAYDKVKLHCSLQIVGLWSYVNPSENHPVYSSITDAAAAGTKVRLVPPVWYQKIGYCAMLI